MIFIESAFKKEALRGLLAAFFVYILTLGTACKKKEVVIVIDPETSTMTDIDGNVYRTVKIGSQWWMAEDLKVTRYRNGDSLRFAKAIRDTALWRVDTSGIYTLYDNNKSAPGLLYNWYAVGNTKALAPAGWHVPTDEEWKIMEQAVGLGNKEVDKTGWRGTNEADKLRLASPQGWTKYGDVWSTNESGFSASAGSCILFDGSLGYPGLRYTAYWWASKSYGNDQAYYRYLDYKNHNVFRSHCDMHYGFSVRCVKDE